VAAPPPVDGSSEHPDPGPEIGAARIVCPVDTLEHAHHFARWRRAIRIGERQPPGVGPCLPPVPDRVALAAIQLQVRNRDAHRGRGRHRGSSHDRVDPPLLLAARAIVDHEDSRSVCLMRE
jgi:hypothetical protein